MNTCENCGNKGKGHGEHPCVACVSYDKWTAPGDGMRELAMSIASGVGLHTSHLPDGFAVLIDLVPLERIVRAAVVEGMRRAATICTEYGFADSAEDAIRAEAERIKG